MPTSAESSRRIVVAGGAGAMPFAGVGWQVAQYLEGLRRLGHDVFYLEDTERWPYDPLADTLCRDAGPAVAYVAALMRRCGLSAAWAYRDAAAGGRLHGCSEERLADLLSRAEILINLSGQMLLREEHLQIPVRVHLETDPVRNQILVAQGDERAIAFLSAHTHHFTYGENFGAPDCGVPIERFEYRPTRPPVILDWWPGGADGPDGRPFTTIGNWRQRGRDVTWGSQRLTWSKHHEFERMLDLPRRIGTPIELALSSAPSHTVRRLQDAGWLVRPAAPLSKDLEAYRRFIVGSAGEFSVAKQQNVLLRSGWFSDRTACYLAAGRPAIVQDTGFGCALPTGEGLMPFADIDEAVAAFESIQADYAHHAAAAREIAEQHLRAELVLSRLVEALEATPSLR